ncbi:MULTISPECIES: methyltransferase domain-containing protein [unclassified Micromonospora]|uniref:protein-L-isoaspartate O-methyltransferase family protein n=1 Tax=unclassified Micromonospora TaxID=2617518 RepID=UPI001C2375FF|nr:MULTISPECIES: methyltransferase domain-containing protein [unclassified Micromonospora]MBU8857708.1 methyltransferase domain-containing protein [Micromonospora sp. WMMB482]MDM4783335.1 methyltransferase domain-containing protein [Micromonospora sp. b486]
MTITEPPFGRVPESYYVHNEERGETLHRSAPEAIQRDVTALKIRDGDHVLEIGTGTGYSGALLAAQAGASGRVTSVDISDHLVAWANRLHRRRGVTTITCHLADGMNGYPPHAPYQRIAAWCAPPRLPRAWVDQLTPDGRIVACLPIAVQPSTTLIATITLTAGQPRVETVTFGGYAQSTATAVDDALTLPGRWVDHHTDQPQPAWISIGWREHDDPHHTGARTALHLLLNPGHTETYHRAPLDWLSWTAYSVIAGGPHRTFAALHDGTRGIGHTTATTAAVVLTDGTILADAPGSPSLTALRTWLHHWEQAGRPDAAWFDARLVPNDEDDPPGWDLRITAGTRR